jgi:hypothetical protein
MINKFYKRIHTKYSNFFKFFFFLRYVFIIFFVAITLFLTIPKFFDYNKRQNVIKEYLVNYYNLELNSYSHIEFNIFPFPNLNIQNAEFKIKKNQIDFKTKNFSILLPIKSIYEIKNLKPQKITFDQNEININIDQAKDLFNFFKKIKYKFVVKNLNLNLKRQKKPLIKIEQIGFSNFGYEKYKIKGKIFGKNFNTNFNESNKKLTLKIMNLGLQAEIKFEEKKLNNYISGISEINILRNLLKFNFKIENGEIIISNSNLRNKNISVSFDSIIKFYPFFDINSNIRINTINKKVIDKIILNKILSKKEIIKKFNGNNVLNYQSKKYRNNLIKSYSSVLDLAYGRMTFTNNIIFLGGEISCKGNGLLIDEYPRLVFSCLANLKDKKKFYRNFLKSKEKNNLPLNLDFEGSFNLVKKKINFKKIESKDNYVANDEDLKYFKEVFERVLLEENFFNIFNEDKIKEFFIEII